MATLRPQSPTYSYLLADHAIGEAVRIDPVYEQAPPDAALIHELGLDLRFALETHVYADHVTAASVLKQLLGSRIAVAAAADVIGADHYLNDRDVIWFGNRYVQAPRYTWPHERLSDLCSR